MKNITCLLFEFIISLGIIFIGCKKEEDILFPNIENSKQNFLAEVIAVDDALKDMNTFLRDIGREEKVSHSKILTIGASSFGILSDEYNIPDTLIYIINFQNNMGYAVMAANTVLNSSLISVTKLGELTEADIVNAVSYILTLDNETNLSEEEKEFVSIGEKFVPVTLVMYLLQDVNDGNRRQIHQDDDVEAEELYKYNKITQLGPFLQTKWGQRAPYNDSIPENHPAGCVAVAAAQIVAHHGIRNEYDWNLLKSVGNINNIDATQEANQLVASFLLEIGNRENCNIRYSSNGSWGVADGAKRTFRNFGFEEVSKHVGFVNIDQVRVNSHLSSGGCVFMTGGDGFEGHAWVIDGLLVRNKVRSQDNQFIERQELYHINWGWNGKADGYFTQGVFDLSARVDVAPGDALPGYSGLEHYSWCYRTIVYDL